MSKKTVKMFFTSDQYWNLQLLYSGGQSYDVPEDKVERWLKRGAVIVSEEPEVLKPKQELSPVVEPVKEVIEPKENKLEDSLDKPKEEDELKVIENKAAKKYITKSSK